jgi:hypothetical protein
VGGSLQWEDTMSADPAPTGPRYLRLYKDSHFRALGERFDGGLSWTQFLDRVRAARVLYLGDHHADPALHQRMLALLADLDHAGVRYHLGLECVGTQDAPHVDRYLRGEMDLEQLAASLQRRWSETWLRRDGVDSLFYRELLAHARRAARPVFALEPTPRLPLYERDQAIARTLLQRARANTSALLVVIVGETHLLGHGQLVQRVGLPHVVLCANFSVRLRELATTARVAAHHRFAATDAGVLFFANALRAQQQFTGPTD